MELNYIMLALGLGVAYLVGAMPTAYVFTRLFKGTDIRTLGSGNVGATNVYRAVGKLAGLTVLVIDILKGVVPVVLIPVLLDINKGSDIYYLYKILLGFCAICGHVWTVFLKFKGGKGVATTAGVVLVIAPKVVGIAFLIWLLVLALARYVSLASIIAALSLPVTGFILKEPTVIILFLSVMCLVGVYRHKANIARLLKGKENRIF